MKKFFVLYIAFSLFNGCNSAIAENTGIINFNVNNAPIKTVNKQPVQVLGCNTIKKKKLFWGVDNQLMKDLPYGQKTSNTGKSYFVSKYYLASPPVPKGTTTNIGLLTPDNFRFEGTRPAKIVNLDYSILKQMSLGKVKADFSFHPKSESASCNNLGVKSVPINIHCPDFPWQNGALGASGIGVLENAPDKAEIFVAIDPKTKSPLQCYVTILDDIILDHEVSFSTSEGKNKTVDLTMLYKTQKSMNLTCQVREKNDIPSGCRNSASKSSLVSESTGK
jgi:hypothetical protein